MSHSELAAGVRPMERALFSLFRKEGESWEQAVEIAKVLSTKGCENLASGGTYLKLVEAGVKVTRLDDFFVRCAGQGQAVLPSNLFGGFIRTISPQVFGGIFAQRGIATHREHLTLVGSDYIDVLIYDFYPDDHVDPDIDDPVEALFAGTDIGGPAVVEAGIKAGCWVALPTQFEDFLRCLVAIKKYDTRKANRWFRGVAKGNIASYQEHRADLIQEETDGFWTDDEDE